MTPESYTWWWLNIRNHLWARKKTWHAHDPQIRSWHSSNMWCERFAQMHRVSCCGDEELQEANETLLKLSHASAPRISQPCSCTYSVSSCEEPQVYLAGHGLRQLQKRETWKTVSFCGQGAHFFVTFDQVIPQVLCSNFFAASIGIRNAVHHACQQVAHDP